MARGSYGAWGIPPDSFDKIRKVAIDVLKSEGYVVNRRASSDRQVKIEGLRGSKWLAYLGQQIPLGTLFGIGSRVKATVLCRKSLTDEETDLRLTVRVAPVQELDSVEEEYLQTQGRIERIGDDAKARKCFAHLVGALRNAGVIP